MSTYYGIIKIKEPIKIHYGEVQKGEAFIGSPRWDTNPTFFMESDDLAERCVVKETNHGSYLVDWVILDKKTDKESKKTIAFKTFEECHEWLLFEYFVNVKSFFTSNPPTSKDIELYSMFMMDVSYVETPIINL